MPMSDSKLPSALVFCRHCNKGRNTALPVGDDSGKGITIWDDNGFNSVLAKPLLLGAHQLDILLSHSPPSPPPLFTAQFSVGTVSNCCNALDSDCSGPLGCLDDTTRFYPGYEEEFNNWFIEDGLDTPVGLVFDVTAVCGLKKVR